MRRPTLSQLAGSTHDLLVIGGGIIGCGVARDAALRGLRVALVERDDFGSGTTSRSTRLIHGGLRYLELYDFGLVREDLREREILLRIASHLVKPLPFLVPMYGLSLYGRARLRAGMLLYDVLSFDKSLPSHDFLSREETLAAEPNLDPTGLQGAARYYDAQVAFPERLTIENALDAAARGALLRNHTTATRFLLDGGRVTGAMVRDSSTGEETEVRARLTMNVTGAWLDGLLDQIRPGEPPLLRTTKGVHLVTPRLGPNAVVLFARSDGRLFFVVPWHDMSLIGTTDTDEPNPPELSRATADDVRYLIQETRRAFPGMARVRPYYSMAGVRALVRKEGLRESQVSRKHRLCDHAAEGGPAGLISVVGGKITGYRWIAEDAVNLAARKLHWRSRSETRRRPLPGNPRESGAETAAFTRLAGHLRLSDEQRCYLLHHYGRHAEGILELAAGQLALAETVHLGQPTIAAEIIHAIREEAATKLLDIMLRRTPLGFAPDQAREAAQGVAAIAGRELGWTDQQEQAEVTTFYDHLARLHSVPEDH